MEGFTLLLQPKPPKVETLVAMKCRSHETSFCHATTLSWRTKPSWAVIATEDNAFDIAMVRHMAQRMGAKVTEVAASHAVFMTQPQVVAQTIEMAAQTAAVAAN
jgi:pimeloyl-ACP methyl ester carboxylesterase